MNFFYERVDNCVCIANYYYGLKYFDENINYFDVRGRLLL